MKYTLSPNAQKSLKQIKAYSTSQFGDRQTIIYLDKLRSRLKYLAEDPKYGKERDDIKQGYYSYLEGSHTIYYMIKPKHIEVIDILHQSMEPKLHI